MRSESSLAAGGGSGGGLVRGNSLDSEGDSRGAGLDRRVDVGCDSQCVDEADVLDLGRDVTGNLKPRILPPIELKGGAASGVFGVLGPSLTSCWAIRRVSSRVML